LKQKRSIETCFGKILVERGLAEKMNRILGKENKREEWKVKK